MNDKLIEVMAKAVVYTCMVLTAAALIFMFSGVVAGRHLPKMPKRDMQCGVPLSMHRVQRPKPI